MPSSPIGLPQSALPTWLAGTWTVDRDINTGRGSFTGQAVFAAQPDGTVRWSEEGTLHLDGFTGPGKRVLFLHPAEPWEVRFDDGNLFHPLDLSSGRDAAEHLCGPDVYRGGFEIEGDDAFVVRWAVAGPGRDDLIVSRYRRT